MLLFGVIVMLASTGGGAYLCWENRHARVHLEAAGHVWTGHLYGVLLAGAILAGWTMLGLSCVALWVRERRERKAAQLPAEAQEDERTPARRRRSQPVLPAGARR